MITAQTLRLTAAACVAMVLSVVTLVPASAASPASVSPATGAFPLAASVVIGSNQFQGFFVPVGAKVKLTQSRHGTTLAKATRIADTNGDISAKLKPLHPGDTVLINVDGTKRTLTIPDLRLSIDAATDRLSGRVPTSHLDAALTVARQVGSYSLGGDGRDFTAHADGTFNQDVTSIHDVQGGELVQLVWSSPAEDTFVVDSYAPAVSAEVGRSKVDVYGKRGTTATVTLKASNGAVRGSAKVTLPVDGRPATATFRKNGAAVKVHTGDRIVHSEAPSVAFTLLPDTLGLTAAAGGDVSATCFSNTMFVLGHIFGSGAVDFLTAGLTNGGGALSAVNVSHTGTPLPSGYRVILWCEDSRGNSQVFRAAIL